MSTADDFTVFRRVAGDKIAELMERAERAERELAAKDAGIASLRAQLRDADKEMPRFHRLEDELAATQILLHESLIREDRFYRELAAKDTEKYCFASCAFHAAQDAEIARLREAANAVVERWETPLWKDVKPTAHIIYALRDELAAQQQASK